MEMTTPVLSIIVPVYNVEKYLARCIDSILAQTFTDFELILVDDGSTDNSGEICDDYMVMDPRIVVLHKQNGGQSSARNAGLDITRGEYITFVDSDDYISSDCYKGNMDILQNDRTIDILEFPIYIERKGCVEKMLIPDYLEGKHLYSKRDFFSFWSNGGLGVRGFVVQNIYKKDLWNSVRFKEKVVFEDCLIQSTLLEKASHVYISGIGKYLYVQREGSTLHSGFSKKKCIDDFNATIPFLHQMVRYGVDQRIINRFYCVTLNRILDKSDLFGIDSFLEPIGDINKVKVGIIGIITAPIEIKQKIKLVASRLLGVYRYLKVTSWLLDRKPICHD